MNLYEDTIKRLKRLWPLTSHHHRIHGLKAHATCWMYWRAALTKRQRGRPSLSPYSRFQTSKPSPPRELLTEKMLADRWVCSVARLQCWRTVGEGPPYLKIVGKVLYRLKDIEAYEEASLVRKTF